MSQRIKLQQTLGTAASKGIQAALTQSVLVIAAVISKSVCVLGIGVVLVGVGLVAVGLGCCCCWHRFCCWGVRVRRRSSWQMLGCWMWAGLLGAPCLLLPCPLPAPGTRLISCRGTRYVCALTIRICAIVFTVCALVPAAYLPVC